MLKPIYIKICRYLLGKKFMKVMEGPLKGYLWTTASSYAYLLGNYEDPATLGEFIGWLQADTVFYDLGGNIGFYALLANRYITTGKIYSFEPMPASRMIFEKHLAINRAQIQYHNIRLLPLVISDREKELAFSNETWQMEGNTYITTSPNFKKATHTISVKCHSIDELVRLGYDPPDVMKIDVEGAEYDVLQGSVDTLKRYRPRILLATHECHLPGVRENCVRFLESLGYVLQHTGKHNKRMEGLDDYVAIPGGVEKVEKI